MLDNESPDLAVARGAVAYGLGRHGRGIRIGAGSARSYFLMLEAEKGKASRAVCILPRGAEEGREVRLQDRVFSLRLGQPVRFHVAASTGDKVFQPGDLAEWNEDAFSRLPPIATILPEETGSEEKAVNVAAVLTEIGTLEINCLAVDNPSKRWNLEFQLRGAGKTALGMSSRLHPHFGEAADRIQRIFGSRRQEVGAREVKGLRRDLEGLLGERDTWDTAVLRELFGALWDGARRRRRTPDHERVWFNLSGFCLRPGYGYPLDDWRVQQLWSIHEQGVQYVREAPVWLEWWTLWRRVAGGLDRQAQEALLQDLSPELQPAARQDKRPKTTKQGYDTMVRLVGALERIHYEHKIEVGRWLLERLKTRAESDQTWGTVGRRAPACRSTAAQIMSFHARSQPSGSNRR